MATNKVVYSGRTLIDLTDDTITEEALLRGYTAHKADGTQIVGTAFADYPERYSFLDPLQDSNGEKILDNSNNVLQGETVYKRGRNVVYFLNIPILLIKEWLKIKVSCFH